MARSLQRGTQAEYIDCPVRVGLQFEIENLTNVSFSEVRVQILASFSFRILHMISNAVCSCGTWSQLTTWSFAAAACLAFDWRPLVGSFAVVVDFCDPMVSAELIIQKSKKLYISRGFRKESRPSASGESNSDARASAWLLRPETITSMSFVIEVLLSSENDLHTQHSVCILQNITYLRNPLRGSKTSSRVIASDDSAIESTISAVSWCVGIEGIRLT